MPIFPEQGGSKNTWGTELRDFFSPYFDLTTGDVYPDAILPVGSLNGNRLIDGTVAGTKITAGGIDTLQLANNSVTTDKIAPSAVTSSKIANSTILEVNISAGAISNSLLANSAVTAIKLATDAVETAKILDAAVTSSKLANNSVLAQHISAGQVDTDELANLSITTGKLADGSVTIDKIGFDIAAASNIPENITWEDLDILKTGNGLTPGKYYSIADFRSRCLIPETATYNYELSASAETLVVKAATVNSFFGTVYSETYPDDIIEYEFNYSGTYDASPSASFDRGRIIYRKDKYGNEACEDFRGIKYRRWETGPGNGLYYSLTDTGYGYQDYYVFGVQHPDSLNGAIRNNVIESNDLSSGTPQNIVLQYSAIDTYSNIIRSGCYSFTLGDGCINNIFDSHCYNIKLGDESNENYFKFGCYDINLGHHARENTFNQGCYDIWAYAYLDRTTFDSYSHNIDIYSDYVEYNIFGKVTNGVVINGPLRYSIFDSHTTLSYMFNEENWDNKKVFTEGVGGNYEFNLDPDVTTDFTQASWVYPGGYNVGVTIPVSAGGVLNTDTVAIPFGSYVMPSVGITINLNGCGIPANDGSFPVESITYDKVNNLRLIKLTGAAFTTPDTGTMTITTMVNNISQVAGIVQLMGGGGTFDITSFSNFPDHPVTIKAEPGYTFYLDGTPVPTAPIGDETVFFWNGTVTLVGDDADKITLEKVTITNGNGTFQVLKEKT